MVTRVSTSRPEDSLQKKVVTAARDMGFLTVRIKNEGKRTFKQTAYEKAMGMTPGTPDLAVIAKNGRVLWMELKVKTSLSDNQQDFGDTLVSHGHLYSVCRSYDEALAALAKLQVRTAA